jgi:hypothetical protein
VNVSGAGIGADIRSNRSVKRNSKAALSNGGGFLFLKKEGPRSGRRIAVRPSVYAKRGFSVTLMNRADPSKPFDVRPFKGWLDDAERDEAHAMMIDLTTSLSCVKDR